ncbi:testis-expressed protein 2-like isoform X1 [Alosa sapidissima]|uniref:testis-expressed protein 2-like isoform X1 n=1 Tax=Alosa sapidissima TaxID=34773 RepID=UPI001C0834A7|nr:testis-expressed protein 2-like isoform X1 [Alosa sapidissima]XP_041958988.1 testis-expressed protein 2-like isoform X1 [Alosa sapidissima]
MTSRQGGHAERQPPPPPSASRLPAAAKLQVQHPLSRDNITIHFSALGKGEEEEEEELYGTAAPSSTPAAALAGKVDDGSRVAEAQEASEGLGYGDGATSMTGPTVIPMFSSSSTVSLPSASSCPQDLGPAQPLTSSGSSSGSAAKGAAATPAPASAAAPKSSSPSRSITLPSADKPFLQLIKSLSSDLEPRDGMRHRQIMKNIVKSLSSDNSSSSSSQDASASFRLPDSRLNLQLFKPFSQPRVTTGASSSSTSSSAATGDSKTAPSSPLTSPESRFSLAEVEARIEDTKRRWSEAMYEPLQRLSKIMGDESGAGLYRPKGLSTSASELSSLAGLNGHLESNNNNYSIKEEEADDSDGEGTASAVSAAESPLAFEKCSMSALARQEDEEFCELYSEDFDFATDNENETDAERTSDSAARGRSRGAHLANTDPYSDDEQEGIQPAPSVPLTTLFALTLLTYGYFVVPLPDYVGTMVVGMVLGFMVTIGAVWLAGPKQSGGPPGRRRSRKEMWSSAQLDIKEPGMFKGWMNEIQSYDPETYHATLTHSVFVRLEGSTLRLSRPNRNIARRVTINESKPDVTYVSQKIYDLTDSKIQLVPQNLARKRVWNKKYPICIELGKQDDFMSKAEGEPDEERTNFLTDRSEVTTGAEEVKRPGQETGRLSSGSKSNVPTLYLFGRTGREKEEWFQKLLQASRLKAEMARKASSLPLSKSAANLTSHSRSSSRSSLDELLSAVQPRQKDGSGPSPSPVPPRPRPQLDYSVYMSRCMPSQDQPQQQMASPVSGSPQQSPHSSPGASKKLPGSLKKEEESVAWVNALVGRVAWDFLGEKYWVDWVSKKIQMKLSKIRLPYFMNELTLTELDMGFSTPRILQASKPSVDHQGLWFDLEVSYKGSFLMTLETKMNLARLGKEGDGFGEFGKDGSRPRAYCLADSDEESSSAGSSDEEDPPELTADQTLGAEGFVGGHKHSKIMRFVDKITKSKYFQKATETEFIKKKMEEVSNTPLLLTVEVQECRGTLAVNIPPPPTDRIWYGFRTPPQLDLRARPKLGEREVTFAHVTDWIEKKLYQEFQKILVMPNMDDVWLHIMHSAMDPRSHPPSSECDAALPSDL